jgi:hypothetical protein
VSARDESTNGTKLNGNRMVRGEAVALKEGDELRIVLKEDLMPTPPHAICPEKLKVVFVFHLDVDEARRRVAQATAQATAAAATPAATAACRSRWSSRGAKEAAAGCWSGRCAKEAAPSRRGARTKQPAHVFAASPRLQGRRSRESGKTFLP